MNSLNGTPVTGRTSTGMMKLKADFAARMDWWVAGVFKNANHNPAGRDHCQPLML